MTNQIINQKIIDYLLQYNPIKIGIFGSYSRNENNESSDLDILVNLKQSISLLQLVRIERELSETLGIKVDLITEGALKNQKLKTYIETDLVIIYQ
jgi:hypothetical protein